jgi:predicted PurR-regulated permease PerM
MFMVKFLKKYAENILILALVLFLYCVSSALTPFFIGITIAYISLPIISLMVEKLMLPKNISIIFSVCLVYTILGIALILFIPFLHNRLSQIINSIISLDFKSIQINQELTTFVVSLQEMVIAKIPGYVTSIVNTVISSTQSLISLIFSLIFAPMISIYFLQDIHCSKNKVIKYLNNLAENFVKLQLLMIIFYTFFYLIVLESLQVNDSISLSIISSILYTIPYIGPITGCTISALMVATQYGFDFHIAVLILSFLGINIIDTIIISPRFIGPKFGLHPLMTIFSLLVSAYFFGIIGMIFAIPLGVLMKDFWLFVHSYKNH